jgi:hypothetical protein
MLGLNMGEQTVKVSLAVGALLVKKNIETKKRKNTTDLTIIRNHKSFLMKHHTFEENNVLDLSYL